MYVTNELNSNLKLTFLSFKLDEVGHTKETNVTELMEHQAHSTNNKFFNHRDQQRFSKKPLSASAIQHAKNSGITQQQQESPPIQFFSTPKRIFEQQGSKVPSKEEFNVWAENPISHEVSALI